MDAGLATEETVAWLRAGGYDWITVSRGREAPPERAPDGEFRTRHGSLAKAWRLEEDEPEGGEDSAPEDAQGESRLCIWSERRQDKEEAMLAQQRERFESELEALHAGLSRPGCTKRCDKVVERLGRLRERRKRVSGQYRITVEQAPAEPPEGGRKNGRKRPPLAAAVRWERNRKHAAKDAEAGTCVLRTSHGDRDPERVVRTYWQLAEIEATFRSLKSEIGLRPIWHARADRIRVHLLRRRLGERGYPDRWAAIRRKLAGWVRLTTTLRTVDGHLIECRQDARPDLEATVLARAAGVEPRLHRVRTRRKLF